MGSQRPYFALDSCKRVGLIQQPCYVIISTKKNVDSSALFTLINPVSFPSLKAFQTHCFQLPPNVPGETWLPLSPASSLAPLGPAGPVIPLGPNVPGGLLWPGEP